MKLWWKRWGELVQRLLALTASFLSLLALLLPFLPAPKDMPWWTIALLISSGFFLIVLLWLELSVRRAHNCVYAHNDGAGIRRYMHDWIEHGGRVAIWTRDMSWAQNPDTRSLLTAKARANELILCLPEPNGLSIELATEGAEVCAYGADRLDAPASRFTIVFFGRDGSRVAVGRAEGDTHVIDEFSAATHPAFHLAEDLVSLARSLGAQRRTQ